VVGYGGTFGPAGSFLGGFRKGLADWRYVEGRNVAIDYVTDGQYDRLPIIAADFARRKVALIVAVTTAPALAAKAATRDIPIVFNIPDDPVKLGLIATLARPGGNANGMNFF